MINKYINDKINNEIKQNIKFSDYLIMFLLLGMSVNPFLGQQAKYLVIISLLFFFIKYPEKILELPLIDPKALIIISFFISFLVIHRFLFNINNELTIIKLLLFFLFSYFSVKILKDKFIKVFINIVYYLAIISLIFYALSQIDFLENFLYSFASKAFPLRVDFNNYSTPTLLIYTFNPIFHMGTAPILRNAGFAWEAGAFAIFLNIALFLNLARNNLTITNIFSDKKSFVYIITIISTFSTTGYLVLCFILFIISLKKKGFGKYFLVILMLIIFLFSFFNLEFMGNKIIYQLGTAETSHNRFGSFLLDWQDIKKSPILGWSRKPEVLFGNEAYTQYAHRPNGITNLIRTYGFLYFVPFIILLYTSFKKYFIFSKNKNYRLLSFFILIIILMSAFSELILDTMIVKSFLFLYLPYKKTANKSGN